MNAYDHHPLVFVHVMTPRGQASSSKLNKTDSAHPQTPATSKDLAERLKNIENEACDILAVRRGDLSRDLIRKTVKLYKDRAFAFGTDLDELHLQHSRKRSKNNKGRSSHREHNPFCQTCSEYIEDDLGRLIGLSLRNLPADERSKNKGEGSTSTHTLDQQNRDRSPRPYSHAYAEASTTKDDGSTMECEICCSDDVLLKDITQCPEGHVFCFTCARKMAETQIGMQKVVLPCMSMEGCEATFTESEVRRFLKPETMDLWIRIKARDDISAASIPGLSTCPFCEYMVIIEGDIGKTLECRNPSCLKVTCRSCKKLSHAGLSCEQARSREPVNDRQKAEEELAEALIRRCPKCSMAILKDESLRSCNKMICTKCKVLICYVCRADITKVSYAHFDDGGTRARSSKAKQKCPLYDDTAERHNEDVEAIRKRLGDMAPPVTNIDKRDAARRRKRYERAYGPRAAAEPVMEGLVPAPDGYGYVRPWDNAFIPVAAFLADPQLQADLQAERLVQEERVRLEAMDEQRRHARRMRRLARDAHRLAPEREGAAFIEIPEAERRGGAGVRIGDPVAAQRLQAALYPQGVPRFILDERYAEHDGVQGAEANAPMGQNLHPVAAQRALHNLPARPKSQVADAQGKKQKAAAGPATELASDQKATGSVQRGSRNTRRTSDVSTAAIDLTGTVKQGKGKGKAKNEREFDVIVDDDIDGDNLVHRFDRDRRQHDAAHAAYAMMNMQHREPIPVKAAVKQRRVASETLKESQMKVASGSKAKIGQSPSQAIVIDPPSPKREDGELHVKRLRGGKSYTLDGKSLSSSPPVFISSSSIKGKEKEVSADVASEHKN